MISDFWLAGSEIDALIYLNRHPALEMDRLQEILHAKGLVHQFEYDDGPRYEPNRAGTYLALGLQCLKDSHHV